MRAQVYGIQRKVKWSYQGQEGFNQRLHVIYPDEMKDENSEGFRVEQIKVSMKVPLNKICVNDTVEIYYNRYGQVDQVIKV